MGRFAPGVRTTEQASLDHEKRTRLAPGMRPSGRRRIPCAGSSPTADGALAGDTGALSSESGALTDEMAPTPGDSRHDLDGRSLADADSSLCDSLRPATAPTVMTLGRSWPAWTADRCRPAAWTEDCVTAVVVREVGFTLATPALAAGREPSSRVDGGAFAGDETPVAGDLLASAVGTRLHCRCGTEAGLGCALSLTACRLWLPACACGIPSHAAGSRQLRGSHASA